MAPIRWSAPARSRFARAALAALAALALFSATPAVAHADDDHRGRGRHGHQRGHGKHHGNGHRHGWHDHGGPS